MKHEIEVEVLPEGWKAVAYRVPMPYEHIFMNGGVVSWGRGNIPADHLIVEKIQPRRIVLEETGNANNQNTTYKVEYEGIHIEYRSNKVWNVVKEE